jgi:hypothetical protein
MSLRKPKVAEIVVRIPVELAIDLFNESGDLPSADFPAVMKLVESIAEVLDIVQAEKAFQAETVFVGEKEDEIPVSKKPLT